MPSSARPGVNGPILVTLSAPIANHTLLERFGIGVSHACTTSSLADTIAAIGSVTSVDRRAP